PRVGRHDRIGNGCTRIEEMRKVPVIGAQAMFPGEIWSNPSCSPQMRIVVLRFPWSRGSTESHDIRGDDAYLFGVTERASLATVHHAAMRFARGERLQG